MNLHKLNRIVPLLLVCFLMVRSAPADDPIAYLVADLNGDPYATEGGQGQIDAFDASGNFISTVVTGLTVPSGLTIGPNGYLYVANHGVGTGNGQILVYNPGNNYAPVNGGGIVNGVLASGLTGPGGIVADSSTIFVSELGEIASATPFQGNTIERYNTNGTLVSDTNNPLTSGTTTGLTGMAFDSAGNLYVGAIDPPTYAGNVLEFAKNSTTNPAFGATPTVYAAATPGSSGILFHDGTMYVADQFAQSVAGYDSSGSLIPSTLISGLSFPAGLFDLDNGNMLITEIGGGASSAGQIDLYNFATSALTPGIITGTGIEGDVFEPTAVISVPEPNTLLLIAVGFAMLMGVRKFAPLKT